MTKNTGDIIILHIVVPRAYIWSVEGKYTGETVEQ